MACASNVLPEPGGPCSRNPRGAGNPMRLYTFGLFTCNNNSHSSFNVLSMPPMLSNVYSDFFGANSFLNFFDSWRFGGFRGGAFRSEPLSNEMGSSRRFFVCTATGDKAADVAVTTRAFFDFIVSSRRLARASAAAVTFDIEPSTTSFGVFENSLDACPTRT